MPACSIFALYYVILTPDYLDAGSRHLTSADVFVTILSDEATLSQQLHTSPLPMTHVLVGFVGEYCWQNNR